MNNYKNRIELIEINFLGLSIKSNIKFKKSIYILNGASNTGKSFLIESIDYMLGKEKIDKIDEASKYDEIQLQIKLDNSKSTLFRKFDSALFEVYNDFIDLKIPEKFKSYYKVGKATSKVQNINNFYLGEVRLENKTISSNLWAEKSNLTIRLLSRIIISKEEKIISTHSPIEEGDRTEKSANRNVFKFLLTGKDDSKINTITRAKEFKSEKNGRVGALEDIVSQLKISLEFPEESFESLNDRKLKIAAEEELISNTLSEIKNGLSKTIEERKYVSNKLKLLNDRSNDLTINSKNFQLLSNIYISQI
jgi:hypothetical protein